MNRIARSTCSARKYATHANRRVYPTTSTSPTPSTSVEPTPLQPSPLEAASTSAAVAAHAKEDEANLQLHTGPQQEITVPVVSDSSASLWPQHVQNTYPQKGAKRPHLGIRVNPHHGLWHFFRLTKFREAKTTDDEPSRERVNDIESTTGGGSVGTWRRVAFEDRDLLRSQSSRSWLASELRRKSFPELHALWYIVLRERNLTATQLQEASRLLLGSTYVEYLKEKAYMCQKTHARIKLVLSERRRGYERAIESLPGGLAKWRKEQWGRSSSSSEETKEDSEQPV